MGGKRAGRRRGRAPLLIAAVSLAGCGNSTGLKVKANDEARAASAALFEVPAAQLAHLPMSPTRSRPIARRATARS